MLAIFKFGLYLLLLAAGLVLHALFFPDLIQRLSGGSDWFIPINTSVGLLPFSTLSMLLLGLTALVSLLRLLGNLLKRQAGLELVLRLIVVGTALPALLLLYGVETVRPQAWSAYQDALDQAVIQLKPGMSPEQAEARLLALHPAPRDHSESPAIGGSRHLFGKNLSLGTSDSYRRYGVSLLYGPDGKLKSWQETEQVFVDTPQECQVLREYPAQGASPHPCPQQGQA